MQYALIFNISVIYLFYASNLFPEMIFFLWKIHKSMDAMPILGDLRT